MKIASQLLLLVGILAGIAALQGWRMESAAHERQRLAAERYERQARDNELVHAVSQALAELESIVEAPEMPSAPHWTAHLARGETVRAALQRTLGRAPGARRYPAALQALETELAAFARLWADYAEFDSGRAAAAASHRLRELQPVLRARVRPAAEALFTAIRHAQLTESTAELAALERSRRVGLAFSAGLIVALLAAAWQAHRIIIRPLRRMERDARAISAGQQSVVRFSYNRTDELGSIARAFNDALDALHATSFSRGELERLVAERSAELARSHRQLQQVIQAGGQGFWDWDIAAGRVVFSGHWASMLGYRLEEIEHAIDTWKGLVHPDDLPAALRALDAHLAGTAPHYEVEHRLRTATGEWKWVLTRGVIVERDAGGRATRVSGTHTDIHARKATAEELRRREEQLRQLADNFPEGALYQFVVPRDGPPRTTYLGDGFRRIFGLDGTTAPFDAESLQSFVLPEDLPAMRAANERALRTQQPFRHEVRIRTGAGEIKWLSFRSHPRAEQDGQTIWDGVMIDITRQKHAELAVAQQVDFFAALNATAIDLLARREKDALLQAIVERTSGLLDAPHVELALIEDGVLVTRAYVGQARNILGDRATREQAKLSWRAIDQRQPIVVDDYQHSPEARDIYCQLRACAAGVFPILHGTECLGILGLVRHRPGHGFNLEDLQKGQLIAQLAALVLHNSTIYEDAVRVAEARTVALRESEWRLREAQRIAHIGHWEYAFANGNKLEHWSDETYRIFGLEPQSVAIDRAQFDRFIHPEDLPALRASISDVWSRPRRIELDYRIVLPDGSVRHIHDEGEPKCDEAGRIVGMQGIVQDVTERAAAQRALRESEEKFRGLFDHSPVPMVLVTFPEGRIADVNAAVTRDFGFARSECVDRHVMASGMWPNAATRAEYLAQLGREGSAGNVEVTMQHRDGRTLDLLLHSRLLQVAGHAYSLNTFIDVTPLRQIDRALRESEKHYRELVENITQGYYVANRRSQFTYCNPAIYAISGFTPEELRGASCFRLVAEEARAAVMERYRAAADDPACRTLSCEFPVRVKSGRTFWVEQTSDFVRDAGGQLLEVRHVLRDITERKQAQDALRESEQRFHAVFQQSPIMIFLLSFPEGRIIEVNAAATAGFGATREEVLGRTSLELMGWIDLEDRNRYLQLLLSTGHVTGFETRMRRRDGRQFTALFSGSLIEIAGQRYSLNSIQDITLQRQAEARVREKQKMEALGTLAGGIAHDFNNILTGMFGFVELTRSALPPDHPSAPWLENVAVAGQRARNLVQQILTFSRQNEGTRETVDVAAVAAEALRLLRSTLPPMVRIESDLSLDAPRVLADATQLHQVVMNLGTNAWHALPESGGTISVAVAGVTISDEAAAAQADLPRGRALKLTVADNGCGIPPAMIERIFDPFFTTKPAGKGTGLGLAVVHGVVRAHGGAILVHSAPNEGTRFEIYLPAVAGAAPVEPAHAPLPRGRGERLLLIDDEQLGRTALAALIEHLGYQVDHFEHPQVAITRFAAHASAYALVITDFAMPVMTGTAVTRQVRAIRPDIPVLLVSGFIDAPRQKELDDAGVTVVLRKPPTMDEIAVSIARCIAPGREG